jgi:hypothetical protein
MGLKDEMAQAAKETRPGLPCRVKVIYGEMQKPDLDDLRDALSDPAISSAVIARVLTERGYKISSNTVGHHRRGGCSCERL